MGAAALAEVGLEFDEFAEADAGADRAVPVPLEQAHTTAPMTTRQPSISGRVATSRLQYCEDQIGCESIKLASMR